jgi:transcriptional regulator with XRE-family HTH domain
MDNNLKEFGENLKRLRLENGLSLRDVCASVDYDPSNWSKIERGRLSPPADEAVLKKWATALKVLGTKDVQQFIDQAKTAQGVIPDDIRSQKEMLKLMPAFFRTLRNKKPSKDEIDKLINLIKGI